MTKTIGAIVCFALSALNIALGVYSLANGGSECVFNFAVAAFCFGCGIINATM